MADRVEEETTTETPRETVVIREDRDRKSNAPLIFAIIFVILILLLLWGISGLFNGGDEGSTDINVQPTTPTTGQ